MLSKLQCCVLFLPNLPLAEFSPSRVSQVLGTTLEKSDWFTEVSAALTKLSRPSIDPYSSFNPHLEVPSLVEGLWGPEESDLPFEEILVIQLKIWVNIKR